MCVEEAEPGLAAVLTTPGEKVLPYILVTAKLLGAKGSCRLSCRRKTNMSEHFLSPAPFLHELIYLQNPRRSVLGLSSL